MRFGKSFELWYIFAKMFRLLPKKSPKILVHFQFWFWFQKLTFQPSKISYFWVVSFNFFWHFQQMSKILVYFLHFWHQSKVLVLSVLVLTHFFSVKSPYNFQNIFNRQKVQKVRNIGKVIRPKISSKCIALVDILTLTNILTLPLSPSLSFSHSLSFSLLSLSLN